MFITWVIFFICLCGLALFVAQALTLVFGLTLVASQALTLAILIVIILEQKYFYLQTTNYIG